MSKNDRSQERQDEGKQAYASPRLTFFGEVRKLTAAGTAMGVEQPPGGGGGVDLMIMPGN